MDFVIAISNLSRCCTTTFKENIQKMDAIHKVFCSIIQCFYGQLVLIANAQFHLFSIQRNNLPEKSVKSHTFPMFFLFNTTRVGRVWSSSPNSFQNQKKFEYKYVFMLKRYLFLNDLMVNAFCNICFTQLLGIGKCKFLMSLGTASVKTFLLLELYLTLVLPKNFLIQKP